MNKLKSIDNTLVKVIFTIVLVFGLMFIITQKKVSAAQCDTSKDLGIATTSVNITADATHRIWSRIKAPDNTNNSFQLEIDGNTCFIVGDGQIASDQWIWVDYQNGNTSSKIDLNLSAGSHSIRMIGNEPGVALDKVMFVTDTNCVPTGDGSNCGSIIVPNDDEEAPTAPQNLQGSLSNNSIANLSWGASTDNVGVNNYGVFRNDTQIATTSNLNYSDSGLTTGTTYNYYVVAYDEAGNRSGNSNSIQLTTDGTPSPSGLPASFTFDSSIESWDEQGNTTLSHSNSEGNENAGALVINTDASGQYPDDSKTARAGSIPYAQGIPVDGGSTVYGQFYVKTSTNKSVRCEIRFFDGQVILDTVGGQLATANSDWSLRTCQATAPANARTVSIRFYAENSDYGDVFYIDDAVLSNEPIDGPNPNFNQADINQDGTVGIVDLSILLNNWDPTGSGHDDARADLNNDNNVGIIDLSIILNNWGG